MFGKCWPPFPYLWRSGKLSDRVHIHQSDCFGFANRTRKFVDAYAKGLNGRQTAWAARKYRGHHIVPEFILDELDLAGIV
ncbi:hypothetical protein B0H11DRAFT_1853313 [Mycena galericulata]|nr:hypothetical protein B0H11DRAFT_1853313 [Mycena galericulata]